MGLASGVTHQGPKRFSGRGRWMEEGQGGVGFGFIPTTWWRGMALSPVCQFFQVYPQNDTKAWSLSSTHLACPSPL